MKPGMQRDILVAFWLLFDEFEIGEDDKPPVHRHGPEGAEHVKLEKSAEKPRRANASKSRRHP